jgi:YHS domain-containing protein
MIADMNSFRFFAHVPPSKALRTQQARRTRTIAFVAAFVFVCFVAAGTTETMWAAVHTQQTSSTTAKALAKAMNMSAANLALKGYDAVAYFEQGKATKGEAAFAHEWQGATWHFSSAQHREMFMKEPARYAPQYGGYCAWAVSRNYTADADPQAWKIVGGKLYLNYNKSVQGSWEKESGGNIVKADSNWRAMMNTMK